MKRLFTFLVSLSLLALCACSTQPAETSSPATSAEVSSTDSPLDLVEQLLAADVFSEPLDQLDSEIAPLVYQLDASVGPVDLRAYRSSGATCEEVAMFIFENEAYAASAHTGLTNYLASQVEINESYRPAQVQKLKNALLIQQDNTVLLVVANDWDAAAKLVE